MNVCPGVVDDRTSARSVAVVVRFLPVKRDCRRKSPDQRRLSRERREKTHCLAARQRLSLRVAAQESDTLGLALKGDCRAAAR